MNHPLTETGELGLRLIRKVTPIKIKMPIKIGIHFVILCTMIIRMVIFIMHTELKSLAKKYLLLNEMSI